jgi:hypothetical protein
MYHAHESLIHTTTMERPRCEDESGDDITWNAD